MSETTHRDPDGTGLHALGWHLHLGERVTCPGPMGFSVPVGTVLDTRTAWAAAIGRAVTAEGACGVVRVRPDGGVDLFDARPESLYLATDRPGTVHLLLT